jgi:ion channel-forming bestrophin family protein
MTGLERVLNTPLPVAYSIAISQITWVYVMLLPFQLFSNLGWVTIPGCIFAAYMILGFAAIGREIENPFGNDVNDLPLDAYCEEIEMDLDIIMSQPTPTPAEFMKKAGSKPLFPLDDRSFGQWMGRSRSDIRDALMTKTRADMRVRRSINPERRSADEKDHHHGPMQAQDV